MRARISPDARAADALAVRVHRRAGAAPWLHGQRLRDGRGIRHRHHPGRARHARGVHPGLRRGGIPVPGAGRAPVRRRGSRGHLARLSHPPRGRPADSEDRRPASSTDRRCPTRRWAPSRTGAISSSRPSTATGRSACCTASPTGGSSWWPAAPRRRGRRHCSSSPKAWPSTRRGTSSWPTATRA